MKIKVSIITVNYKVKEELFSCLDSIEKAKISFPYEVIVIDNDEEKTIGKDLKNKFPKVKYIKSTVNEGFGAGNNLGASKASGEYLFFLNPDTKVFSGAVETLVSFLEKNKQAGIAAPLLTDEKGKIYPLQGTKALTPWKAIFALSFINKILPANPVSKNYWLKFWDKKTIQETDAVPGSAFMISKELFEKLKGFDKKFFLYFEEIDLCKRARDLGYKLFMIPNAKVMHRWGNSTKKSSRNISKIFSESRFYYFKKHYGLFWAWIVHLITSFGKEQLIFLIILILGVFLRVYRLEQNFGFDGEVGDNLLDIKNVFIQRVIPLKGPPTSHPWLSFGPLFYWIYGPVLIFSKFNPISHAYFGVFISVLTIIFNYFFMKELFSKNISLISTFIISISPLYLLTARLGRFTFIVALLIYPFLWMVKKTANGEKKYFFWICFLLGLMLNFHYTPLVLIPFILSSIYIKKVKLSFKNYLAGFAGFILPLIPILIFDAMHKFSMTRNLLLWIPYRILGFIGLYHKNTFTQAVLHENTFSFLNFFSISFVPTPVNGYSLAGICIFFALILFLFWKLVTSFKKKQMELPFLILTLWGAWGFLAVFIHGSPPLHYFVPLLPVPIILLSIFLSEVWSKFGRYGKILTFLTLSLITMMNLRYYFSPSWFYIRQTKSPFTNGYITYESRKKIAQFIVNDAKGKPFILKRVGYNDIFDKQFAQNYIYLLWYYGNEPVKNAKQTYTIVEDGTRLKKLKKKNMQEFIVSNVVILKN